jgi:hypothetical protein
VSLLEQHGGHPVIARADQEALHPPDLAIDGVDPVPGPHLVLTHRNNVFEDRRLPLRSRPEAGAHAKMPGYLGGSRTRDQVALRGVVELGELREGAAQPDSPVGGLDQVHGDKPPGDLIVPGLDDKVGDRLGGGVDDQAAHLAAVTIRAACRGPIVNCGSPAIAASFRLVGLWRAPAQHQRDAVFRIIKPASAPVR